jgi:hypothetical protein
MAQGTPNFAITPVIGIGSVLTASASRNAPTNTVTILAAGSSGTRVERVVATPTGSSVAGAISLYIYNGTTYTLYTEMQIGVNTATPNAVLTTTTLEAVTLPNLMPILLPPGSSLVATTNVTQPASIDIAAIGGSF